MSRKILQAQKLIKHICFQAHFHCTQLRFLRLIFHPKQAKLNYNAQATNHINQLDHT